MTSLKTRQQTSLERRLEKGLQARGFDFESEFPTLSGFIIDFLVFCPDGSRIAVEADGERWHQDKRKEKFRDIMLYKDERIKKVLHFTGHQINTQLNKCLDEIAVRLGPAGHGQVRLG